MDNELRLIQYLYGEEARPEEVEQLLAADDALRTEYRRLRTVKEQLDHRAPSRPDAAVVDRVVAAAAQAVSSRSTRDASTTDSTSRADRAAVRAPSSRQPTRRVLRLVSALAVLLVGVSVGVWQWEGSGVEPETAGETAASTATQSAPSQASVSSGASSDASLPAWDEADDLVRLYRHIETVHARSSPSSWDAPGADLRPASQMRVQDD